LSAAEKKKTKDSLSEKRQSFFVHYTSKRGRKERAAGEKASEKKKAA